MAHEYALTKRNRLVLARAFCHNRRVDLAIDCAIEGQMGKAIVDDVERPTAYCIVSGPFRYFAGDAHSDGGRHMLRQLPPHTLLMPSPPPWTAAAQEIYGEQLQVSPRYQFRSSRLEARHLEGLVAQAKFCDRIVPIGAQLALHLATRHAKWFDIANFDSCEDFAQRGIGFALLDDDQAIGAAYSSLICSKGIEVSIYVQERWRERGVATALAGKLLLSCLEQGIDPHWDAANPASYKLAKKLGYEFVTMYDAYFYGTD